MPDAPPRSLEQRKVALERANRIRSYRARVKRDIAARLLDPVEVLERPSPELATMTVVTLLRAIPGVGVVKANQIILAARISPSRTLAGVTARQRRELAAGIARRARRERRVATPEQLGDREHERAA